MTYLPLIHHSQVSENNQHSHLIEEDENIDDGFSLFSRDPMLFLDPPESGEGGAKHQLS